MDAQTEDLRKGWGRPEAAPTKEISHERLQHTTGSRPPQGEIPHIVSLWEHPEYKDHWHVALGGMGGRRGMWTHFSKLANYRQFRRECVYKLGRAYAPMRQSEWDAILCHAMATKDLSGDD